MKPLEPQETALLGSWIAEGKTIRADETCDRITFLTCNVLKKIASGKSGWETLYQDPGDGRYWEHTYPQGEMHAGGPPALTVISEKNARAKYDV